MGWFTVFDLYGGPDSQIGTKDEDSAAYDGFDDLWLVQNCKPTLSLAQICDGLTNLGGKMVMLLLMTPFQSLE